MSAPTPEQSRVLSMERLLVIDLELTCGPGITHDIQDVIEVGYCVHEIGVPATREATASIYIRPERSVITNFCEKLTGITRQRVANQPNFARTAPRLAEMAAAARVDAWVSWGQDHTLLHRQCVAAGVDNPFGALEHIDVKRLLSPLVYHLTGAARPRGAGAGVGLEAALRQLGLPFSGRAHSGADDAFNAARVVEEVRRLAA